MRFLAALLLAGTVLMAQDAREILNRGVSAFRGGRDAEAVVQFQQAVDLDPTFTTAHLYLATALMQQYVPGADSPQKMAFWTGAEREFRHVVELDPNNRTAIESLASLNLNARKWDDARHWYKSLINVAPEDAQGYYSLGVIDWMEMYPECSKARAAAGLKPADPGPIPDPAVRTTLRVRYWATIDDAIWNLRQALAYNPHASDAMAYMNLVLRQRADLRDTAEEYKRDAAEADLWVQSAIKAQQPQVASGVPAKMAEPRIHAGSQPVTVSLVRQVPPVYPPEAKKAHIEGVVRLAATIDKQGHVQDVELAAGHQLLVPAAMDAVRQWIYKPVTLNGEPVEFRTVVDVSFTLSQ